MEKQQASLLIAEGVRTGEVRSMIDDFNLQRKLNPDVTKAVRHISLSWSKEDAARLSPEIMKQHALEYMEKMKITSTQFILVEHRDKNHPHLISSTTASIILARRSQTGFRKTGTTRSAKR
ncbi:relaxase/mobilization nuclease domain-containing protein [Dyadobacter chenwenxiniae]|uniref:relaxase/mobilization nuclease domain-containing protein n=1 Tax=Dyadobacter chenwenxiniae TaxID=2906456 RepID=UPI0035B63D81